jgi:hypothetical protein
VTVNDYLAQRDAEWMGRVHRFLGLSVGLIQAGMKADERRANYRCDITYTNNSVRCPIEDQHLNSLITWLSRFRGQSFSPWYLCVFLQVDFDTLIRC